MLDWSPNLTLYPWMFFLVSARDDGAFDGNSSAVIKLNTSTILYLREVNRHLALVCILREDSFEKQGLLPWFIIFLMILLFGIVFLIILLFGPLVYSIFNNFTV